MNVARRPAGRDAERPAATGAGRPWRARENGWRGPFGGHWGDGPFGRGAGPFGGPDRHEMAPRRALLRDVLMPVVFGIFIVFGSNRAALDQVPPRRALDAVAYTLIVLAAAGLVFRRRWPLVSLAIAAGATAAYLAGEYPYGPVFFPLGFAVFVVATSQPIRTSMLAGGAALAVVLVGQLSTVEPSQLYTDGLRAAAFFGWLLVPWAVGTMVQYRREAAIREREEDRSRHAYEERLRIARDVHDVVGHGLAVINMQAGIALHVLEKRPEQAAVALDAIKRTSKEALDDLRATLAVYRREEEESAERRPASGLGQLDGLIAATSEAGLPVDHVVEGEPVDLPATIDLTAYRIVQESLTNVVRHAGPASATVRVRYEPGSVTLEVVDNGRARAGDQARAGGHGIAGMRERAAAVGGSLQAGPRAEGGFAVRARLPVGE